MRYLRQWGIGIFAIVIAFTCYNLKANAMLEEYGEYKLDNPYYYTSDGNSYIFGSNNGEYMSIQLETGKKQVPPVKSNYISGDGSTYIFATSEGVTIYNKNGDVKKSLTNINGENALAYSSDARYAVYAETEENQATLYNLETGEKIKKFPLAPKMLVKIYDDRLWIASEGQLSCYDINTHQQNIIIQSYIGDFVITPSQKVIYSEPGKIVSYDLKTMKSEVISDDVSIVKSLAVDPNEYYLAYVERNMEELIVLNLKTNKEIYRVENLEYEDSGKYPIFFSRDSSRLFVSDRINDIEELADSIVEISLPTQLNNIELGKKTNLLLNVKTISGKEKTVSSGIDWTIIKNSDAATISQKKITATKLKTLILQAEVDGFTKTFKIKVTDTTKPIWNKSVSTITIPEGYQLNLSDYFSASDANKQVTIKTNKKVNTTKRGITTYTVTATDSSQNKAVKKVKVKVIKNYKSSFFLEKIYDDPYYMVYQYVHLPTATFNNKGNWKPNTYISLVLNDVFADVIGRIPTLNVNTAKFNATKVKMTIGSKSRTFKMTSGYHEFTGHDYTFFEKYVMTAKKIKVTLSNRSKTMTRNLSKNELTALKNTMHLEKQFENYGY